MSRRAKIDIDIEFEPVPERLFEGAFSRITRWSALEAIGIRAHRIPTEEREWEDQK